MELAMANGFNEMSQSEMMETDGGVGWPAVVLAVVLLVAGACTARGCAEGEAADNAGK